MALNYQRNSYKLWQSAKRTFKDPGTKYVFNLKKASNIKKKLLSKSLLKYKLALQPNKHPDTWSRIAETLYINWESIGLLFSEFDSDYLQLKEIIQFKYKKGFPYLSGPKIFNYWMYIMSEYGELHLKNRSYIEIAPDTHVIQASVKLGIITENQAKSLDRESISSIWREILRGTGIDPIDVHSPLWFWSRNGFRYRMNKLKLI
jgi:hypothetical protein